MKGGSDRPKPLPPAAHPPLPPRDQSRGAGFEVGAAASSPPRLGSLPEADLKGQPRAVQPPRDRPGGREGAGRRVQGPAPPKEQGLSSAFQALQRVLDLQHRGHSVPGPDRVTVVPRCGPISAPARAVLVPGPPFPSFPPGLSPAPLCPHLFLWAFPEPLFHPVPKVPWPLPQHPHGSADSGNAVPPASGCEPGQRGWVLCKQGGRLQP